MTESAPEALLALAILYCNGGEMDINNLRKEYWGA